MIIFNELTTVKCSCQKCSKIRIGTQSVFLKGSICKMLFKYFYIFSFCVNYIVFLKETKTLTGRKVEKGHSDKKVRDWKVNLGSN